MNFKNKNKQHFFTPTPQQTEILNLLQSHEPREIIISAKTGSGKTMALIWGSLVKRNPSLVLDQRKGLKLATGVALDSNVSLEPSRHGAPADTNDNMISFLERRLGNKRYTECLFIVPSIELARQIYNWAFWLASNGKRDWKSDDSLVQLAIPTTSHLKNSSLAKIDPNEGPLALQKQALTKNVPRIIVGTPKTILDLHNLKAIDFSRLQTVIVDEVDRILVPLSRYAPASQRQARAAHAPLGHVLLDRIFKDRVHREDSSRKRKGIGAQVDVARRRPMQFIVSSATINNPLKFLLRKKGWMTKPMMVDQSTSLPSTITYKAYHFDKQQMLQPISQDQVDAMIDPESLSNAPSSLSLDFDSLAECIYALSHRNGIKKALVFIQTNESLLPMRECLKSLGFSARLLTSINPTNEDAENSIGGAGSLRENDFILARDFESRGLDFPGLEHVILVGDYSSHSFIHTSGRIGRFGAKGTAISLLLDSVQKQRYLKMIKHLGVKLSSSTVA